MAYLNIISTGQGFMIGNTVTCYIGTTCVSACAGSLTMDKRLQMWDRGKGRGCWEKSGEEEGRECKGESGRLYRGGGWEIEACNWLPGED